MPQEMAIDVAHIRRNCAIDIKLSNFWGHGVPTAPPLPRGCVVAPPWSSDESEAWKYGNHFLKRIYTVSLDTIGLDKGAHS